MRRAVLLSLLVALPAVPARADPIIFITGGSLDYHGAAVPFGPLVIQGTRNFSANAIAGRTATWDPCAPGDPVFISTLGFAELDGIAMLNGQQSQSTHYSFRVRFLDLRFAGATLPAPPFSPEAVVSWRRSRLSQLFRRDRFLGIATTVPNRRPRDSDGPSGTICWPIRRPGRPTKSLRVRKRDTRTHKLRPPRQWFGRTGVPRPSKTNAIEAIATGGLAMRRAVLLSLLLALRAVPARADPIIFITGGSLTLTGTSIPFGPLGFKALATSARMRVRKAKLPVRLALQAIP